MASVRPIRRGQDSVLVSMRAAGTSAAKTTELQSTRGIHAAYPGSIRRADRSRHSPRRTAKAGRRNAMIPATTLNDNLRITTT